MCDLLHPSIHATLGEVESYVALPVLVVIGLCTLQFIFCQTCQIASTIGEIMKRRAECKPKRKPKPKCPPGPGLLERLKGMFCRKPDKCRKAPRSAKRTCASNGMNEKRYDDWDTFDDDDDDELVDEY